MSMDMPDPILHPPYPPYGYEIVASAQEMTGVAQRPISPADPRDGSMWDGAAWDELDVEDEDVYR